MRRWSGGVAVDEQFDVVVVGGGTGGATAAVLLAQAGAEVLVLERQGAFRDRVRGEAMVLWGCEEVLRRKLADTLVEAGGSWATAFVVCDDLLPGAVRQPMSAINPNVPGHLNVGHPEACEALLRLAAEEGATVRRGIDGVTVSVGADPRVAYGYDGTEREVRCRIIVGADGRQSTVRKALGRELNSTPVRSVFGGMLVEDFDWPEEDSAIGTDGDFHFLVFPRAGGKARLYLGHELVDRPEFAGAGKEKAFLDTFRFESFPGSDALARSRPAGPAALFPSQDSWVDRPYGEGAVLIGDAAGWSDPIIGQGLTIAITDAGQVSDVLLAGADWSPEAFSAYGEERSERMRRIRTTAMLHTAVFSDLTPAGRARRGAFLQATAPLAQGLPCDPADALMFVAAVAALQLGPRATPPPAYLPETVERILNLGQESPVSSERWAL
jgi:2-polyprenyl-6-methoxyphenol hydroxylase-like FAD-dependent oxidoreductase